MTIGPTMPARSADDWQNALQSDDTAEVLSALIWLGGLHWDGQAPPYDEDKAEAEKVSALCSRDGVRQKLMELSHSTNLWVQMAAQATLKDDPKRRRVLMNRRNRTTACSGRANR